LSVRCSESSRLSSEEMLRSCPQRGHLQSSSSRVLGHLSDLLRPRVVTEIRSDVRTEWYVATHVLKVANFSNPHRVELGTKFKPAPTADQPDPRGVSAWA